MNRREFLAGSVCVGSVAAAAGLASAATDGNAVPGAKSHGKGLGKAKALPPGRYEGEG